MERDNTERPMSKLYFIKTPTEASVMQGRNPVIGKIKKVNPKTIVKQQELLGTIYKRRQVPRGKKSGFLKEAVDTDAQQRLTAFAKKERARRAEKLETPPAVGQEAQLREKIGAKSIVGQQEKARQEMIAKVKQDAEKAVEEQKTQALLALPAQLERARLAIEDLAPLQQQQLIALQNVAPDVVEGLLDEWEAKYPGIAAPAPGPAPIPGPAPVPAPAPAPIPIAGAPVDIDALLPILGKDSPRTTANLKRFWGNNKQSATNVKSIKSASSVELQRQLDAKPALDADYLDAIQKIIADKEAQGKGLKFKGKGGMLDQEEGGGFFGDLFGKAKDLAKKGVEKLVEKVSADPIGAVKKAYELGQAGRAEYAKHFGKKIRAGKLFIPKKHQKAIHSHFKKIYGGGWADSFLKGFTLPFQLAAKLPIPGVQQLGQTVSSMGLPSLI